MQHEAQNEITRMGHHAMQLADAMLTVERRLSRILHGPECPSDTRREIHALLHRLRDVRAVLSAGLESTASALESLLCDEGSDNPPS